jgi:hypothetical protein
MKPPARIASYDIAIVGRVARLGAEPGAWSGFVTERQDVEFEVDASLKGSPGLRLTVPISVVSGDRFARKDRPGLSPVVFAKGRKFLVGVFRRDDGTMWTYDVLPWSAADESATRAAIAAQAEK